LNPDTFRIYFDTGSTEARAAAGKKADKTKHCFANVAKLVRDKEKLTIILPNKI